MFIIKATKEERLKSEAEIISKLKSELKKSPIASEICREFGFRVDIVDGISFNFAPAEEVEASAKTVDSKIYLNEKLMEGPFNDVMRYAIHELVHAFQHMEREEETKDPYKKEEYLDRPDELEAFQYQIKFENDARGEEEATEYVEDLLDFHGISKRDRENKKQELLEKV